MQRLAVIFALFAQFLIAPTLWGALPTQNIELNPVRVLIDREDRIHVSYQRQCGAIFAGFTLRTSSQKELFVAVATERPNFRCMGLTGIEELIIPKLKGSDFAAVLSLNTTTEPVHLKLSPVQNFNQVHEADGEYRFELLYTSQCGTALGVNLFPKANGYELSVLEGRSSRFDNCNRATKLVQYPHLNLSHAPLTALANFDEDTRDPRFTLRRVKTQLMQKQGYTQVQYLRRCDEAPVGLVRTETDDGLVLSVLVARYPEVKCLADSPEKIWTAYPEKIRDKNILPYAGDKKTRQLLIKRPSSYGVDNDNLSISTYASCQNDIGIISRTTAKGYAVGILEAPSSTPCNSGLKEVTYTYNWNYERGVPRDVKPLQLVGL